MLAREASFWDLAEASYRLVQAWGLTKNFGRNQLPFPSQGGRGILHLPGFSRRVPLCAAEKAKGPESHTLGLQCQSLYVSKSEGSYQPNTPEKVHGV